MIVAGSTPTALPTGIVPGQPLTALAPMQDVTDLAFMGVVAHYGAPDYFFTEFLRVHSMSRPEKHILRSIDENATGRPFFAQLIGEDLTHLARTVDELPEKIAEILATLRAASPGLFTVKMRIGFEDTRHFDRVLDLVNEHRVDLLSVHGRTVKEMYRSEVHYDYIAHAVSRVRCPVLANGNVTSPAAAARIIDDTRAAGVMIGRHAIRNPWIFRQCREIFAGQTVTPLTLADVRDYVERLYRATQRPDLEERYHVNKMKKYLNFVGQSVDADGAFLHAMRRTETERDLFSVCDQHLLTDPARAFAPEPYPGVIARPNCETPHADGCSLETITA